MENSLLPGQPKEVGVAIEKYMKLDGISVMTKSSIKIDNGKVMINEDEINPEKILISTGREPNFNTDELDKLGIALRIRRALQLMSACKPICQMFMQ